jgi:hypothetical protein
MVDVEGSRREWGWGFAVVSRDPCSSPRPPCSHLCQNSRACPLGDARAKLLLGASQSQSAAVGAHEPAGAHQVRRREAGAEQVHFHQVRRGEAGAEQGLFWKVYPHDRKPIALQQGQQEWDQR